MGWEGKTFDLVLASAGQHTTWLDLERIKMDKWKYKENGIWIEEIYFKIEVASIDEKMRESHEMIWSCVQEWLMH